MRAILPLIIHTVLLILVLFNLAVARSEEGMDKKVLWSALGFAALIVLTAWLLYGPSDEVSGGVDDECPPPRRTKRAKSRPSRVKTGVADASSHQWS